MCRAKSSHLARAKASAAACSLVSHARASLPTRAEASAASGPSGGAAANSLITGATDEDASVLFEVMFRKNNDLRGNITGEKARRGSPVSTFKQNVLV